MQRIAIKNNQQTELSIEHKDGAPAITIDSLDMSKVKSVDTLADLVSLTHTPPTIWVSGYHTKGDGAFGSHIYEWDSTSIEAHNGGTVIKLDSIDNGRYKLRYDDSVNVKWFGAKGDGVTDDTIAIQKAINISDIAITDGTYLCSSVSANMRNIAGTSNVVLKANSSATEVLIVSHDGSWKPMYIKGITVDGNSRNSNGVTFSDNTSGRYTFDHCTFQNCDKAIYKPYGNIGNLFNKTNIKFCNFGYYALGSTSPTMHAGNDKFSHCEFDTIDVCGWYINNNTVDGYGQFVIDSCIFEGAAGVAMLIKDTKTLFQGVVIDNLWVEAASTATTITVEGVTYNVAEYILDSALNISIRNSYIKSLSAINNSIAQLENCRIDPLYKSLDISTDSSSSIMSYKQYSQLQYINNDIFAKEIQYSFYKPSTLSNAKFSTYRMSDNVSTVKLPNNKILSKSFDEQESLSGSDTATGNLVSEGNIYTNANEFTLNANTSHLLGNFTTNAGKYYVVGFTSKTTGDVFFYGDANQGAICSFNPSDEFITQKSVLYAGDSKTIAPYVNTGGSGGTLTIREYQVVEFNTREQAYDYLNSCRFAE